MTHPRKNEFLPLLGLARRAGAVVIGTDAVRRSIRAGEVELVLIAADAAKGQREKITGLLHHREIPWAIVADRMTLGAAVGSGALTAVAVTRKSFAQQLRRGLPIRGG